MLLAHIPLKNLYGKMFLGGSKTMESEIVPYLSE